MIWQLNPLDVKLRNRKLSWRDIERQKERLLTIEQRGRWPESRWINRTNDKNFALSLVTNTT